MGPLNSPPKDGIHIFKLLPEGTNIDPHDSKRNKQPVDMGLPSTPKDGTHQSHSLPEGKTTDPQDLEGNIYPADTGLPATNPDDGISHSQLLPKGNPLILKIQGETYNSLVWNCLPWLLIIHGLALNFEFLKEDSNDDLKDLSDEEVFEAGDDMETDCPHTTEEHSQPPSSTDKESIKSELASLQADTSDIKAMVTEIFCAFKGQSFSTSSENVPMLTLAIIDVNIAVGGGGGGGNSTVIFIQADPIQTIIPTTTPIITKVITPITTITPIKDTPVTEASGSSFITPRIDKGKGIARDIDDSPPKLVKALRKVRQDPNAPALIEYEIEGEMV
ncbi:hypothetical protein Tco_0472034 [Tanacetum coccineum]